MEFLGITLFSFGIVLTALHLIFPFRNNPDLDFGEFLTRYVSDKHRDRQKRREVFIDVSEGAPPICGGYCPSEEDCKFDEFAERLADEDRKRLEELLNCPGELNIDDLAEEVRTLQRHLKKREHFSQRPWFQILSVSSSLLGLVLFFYDKLAT